MTKAIAASQNEGSFVSQPNRIGGFAWCEILEFCTIVRLLSELKIGASNDRDGREAAIDRVFSQSPPCFISRHKTTRQITINSKLMPALQASPPVA